MGKVTGKSRVTVGENEYTLFLGFSGLAELQEKHGQDFLQRLMPPGDAPDGWMPPLAIVRDLILEALQRYHADEADRFLADDIFAADSGAVNALIEASFPEAEDVHAGGGSPGNGKGPTKKRP